MCLLSFDIKRILKELFIVIRIITYSPISIFIEKYYCSVFFPKCIVNFLHIKIVEGADRTDECDAGPTSLCEGTHRKCKKKPAPILLSLFLRMQDSV